MLSRRHLRVKVLQTLYAYFQSENSSVHAGEKELLHSIEKVYDLYLYQLSIFPELTHASSNILEERKKKRLPTREDINPNQRFVNNKAIAALTANSELTRVLEKRKINWVGQQELIRKVFFEIAGSPEYAAYMNAEEESFEADKNFLIKIFKYYIADSETLEHFYEEKSIYWLDDFELVNSMVLKTLKGITPENVSTFTLAGLYNDEEDDKAYMLELFRKTIENNKEYEALVSAKTQNWDVERIALMDILIMKMAVCEVFNFPSIPVKVTLNEYIDISKRYSTPKSSTFINGVLDKLVATFKTEGKIKKTGRGLLE